MASNVFGKPITNATLEGMPEYQGKVITRKDRATVAMNMKNAEGKDANCRTYVENLKAQWGDGISTLVCIYNATGDPVTFVTSHDWWGHIGPAPYPQIIDNGQWGGFLHVKRSVTPDGSNGAVVYSGLNDDGSACDWMASWDTPWNTLVYSNKAYSEIREGGHFNSTVWGVVSDKTEASGLHHTDTWDGCLNSVSTGNYTSPIYEAIFTLIHLRPLFP